MTQQPTPDGEVLALPVATRRAVLAGAGVAAVAVLAGCATYDSAADSSGNADDGADGAADDGDDPGDGSGDAGGAPPPSAKTTDIPVGGGTIIEGRKAVITQPKAGTFKAFTAVCTHQGCTVVDVKNGTINCPCHGSRFSVADGSVVNGPASRPLREISVSVSGTDITLG